MDEIMGLSGTGISYIFSLVRVQEPGTGNLDSGIPGWEHFYYFFEFSFRK